MKRVATSLVLIPLVIYIVLWSPSWAVTGVVALVASLCFHEYRGLAAAVGMGAVGLWAFVPGFALLLTNDALLVLTATAVVALAVELHSTPFPEVVPRAAAALLGIVYIFGCWKFALLLREANAYWLLYALALSWVGDIAAYYIGRAFGRHRLAPRVSPGKSWEGAIASVVASSAFGLVYMMQVLPQVPIIHAIALSALVNVAGQFGDLTESAIKRGAGAKDSSNLLPGHGGMLDRVDSTLFALPLVYLYLKIA
jgi:phosphatidate cytidylyltransferase